MGWCRGASIFSVSSTADARGRGKNYGARSGKLWFRFIQVRRENFNLSSLLLLLGLLLVGSGLEEVLAVLLGLQEGLLELVGICRKSEKLMLVIVKCISPAVFTYCQSWRIE